MRINIVTLILVALMGITTSTAQAALTQVNVRIEGKSETLFEGPIWTDGHEVQASSDTQARSCDGVNVNDPENLTPGPTPTAAAADAMSIIGETFDGQWYNTYDDYFITRFGPDEQSLTEAAYWGVLVNNVFTDVGGCQYQLDTGDEVLWVYDAFKGRPLLALYPVAAGYTSGVRPLTATAELGKPFEVEVVDYADQREDEPPRGPGRSGSSPLLGADVSPVQTSAKGFERIETTDPATQITDAEGRASITFTEPGWHRIKASAFNAEGEAAIRSNRLDVCVPLSGASGCGSPPAEDDVRMAPAFAEESQEEEHEKSTQTGGSGDPSGGPSGDGSGAPGALGTTSLGTTSPGAPGAAPPDTSRTAAPRRAHRESGRVGLLAIMSASPKRLLLQLTAAGAIKVQIAREVGSGHDVSWRVVKRTVVTAVKPGRIEVKLPRVPPGHYRVRVSVAGGDGVTKILTVPRR
jgi:hypothetical protein